MEIVAWVLVVLLAGVASYLGWRSLREDRTREGLRALADDLEAGVVPEAPPAGDGGDGQEIARVREAIRENWVPRGTELEKGRARGREEGLVEGRDQALRGMARYVGTTVTASLADALETGQALEERARAAVNALEDLAFFDRDVEAEPFAAGSVGEVVAEVTREFAADYDVPVKFLGPDRPIRASMAEEALKDALYLLLVNAVRFGAEDTVEVRLQEGDGTYSLEVVDRGAGFDEEVLQRAAEPFYSTTPDSLGLGLTWVQRVAALHGGSVHLRNRSEGGAAVELRLPLGR